LCLGGNLSFTTPDIIAFGGYFLVVALVAVIASRRERDAADYFLAGRNLPWWIIGVSLIASNISTEHFVGMAGSGVDFGLAIASYEWMAAITLVIVARWFLPKLLRHGITTMPEYLERRFDSRSRSWLAFYMLLAYVFVAMATVLYAGGLALQTIFDLPLGWGIVILAAFAGAYTIYGGLKAVVWSDLIQGTMLVLGGVIVTVLGLKAIGGWGALMDQAGDKFHTVLPLDHPELPWFAVFFGGLWIANLFYWGCNQFITQRTLAARDVVQGQYGVIFAAYIKLIIPLIIVVPGIIASVLYADEITRSDMAYPVLLQQLLPGGLSGLMFAALLAAIMSSLDSMLNSSATIFTLDLYHRHLRPESSQRHLILVGRISTGVFLIIGRATASAALAVMIATLPVTLAIKWIGVSVMEPDLAFLDQMWLAGLMLIGILIVWSLRGEQPEVQPAAAAIEEPAATLIAPDRLFDLLCLGVVVLTIGLYVVFF
jgi:SSS family solute:Na+ symporter